MTKKKTALKIKGFYRAIISEYKENKASFFLYFALRAIVITLGVMLFIGGNAEGGMLCLLTLLLFLLPAFVQTTFKVEMPTALEMIVLIFIFAAEILGELGEYYVKVPFWDTMLHTVTGFMAAAIGLSLIDLLNRNDQFNFALSPFFVALVSFCFSMTIGVLWEFFEFGSDCILHTDMQKDTVVNIISSVLLNPENKNNPIIIKSISDTAVNGTGLGINGYLDIGLFDTMKDLIVNFIGAFVFSVFGYFYARHKGKSKTAPIVEGLKMKKK